MEEEEGLLSGKRKEEEARHKNGGDGRQRHHSKVRGVGVMRMERKCWFFPFFFSRKSERVCTTHSASVNDGRTKRRMERRRRRRRTIISWNVLRM